MTPALPVLAILAVPAQPAVPRPDLKAEMFPRANVRLLDGPFRAAQERDTAYLLSLDPDRLLHTFRINAGLPTSAKPLGGWEAPDVELRGHTLGHYLTACSLMYEATGDERLKERALAMVAELRKVQKALAAHGSNPGYLSAFPESFFDRVEERKGVWAPYYTLHKILAGVLDVHRVTGDPTALEIAKGMAGWVAFRASRLSKAQWQAMLGTEFGGMEEALGELCRRTGDPQYLRTARLFDQKALFDPLERGEDPLVGLHANTQIPKAIGAALDCEITKDPRYCKVAETFWDRVALHHSYVIGGNSEYEHFFPIETFSRHLGIKTAETCNTYNMLKLTRLMFELDADPARLDFYERALFNHILPSQDPETGRVLYHLPLKPGAWRTYATPEDSFWCCVGTGLENPARYGDAIYARQGDDLLVNLFMVSELTWPEKGLVLRQETAFPVEETTRLTLKLKEPSRFAVRLRHPAWAASLGITVNGEAVAVESQPGAFATVAREWRDGDVLELRLPMTLHTEAMPDDPSVLAFLYGPVVLAADLGTKGLTKENRYGTTAPEMANENTPPIPVLVAGSVEEALARVKPDPRPLTFRTEGLGRPVEAHLRPLFELFDRRYTVYFHLMDEAAWAEHLAHAGDEAKLSAALDARTVDRVQPGVEADEAAHQLEETRSQAGRFEGRLSRRVFWGPGEFSYALEVPSDEPAVLGIACWGGETIHRDYEILVDGKVIATQALFNDRPGEVMRLEFPIPEHLTRGRDKVRVAFRPTPDSSIGAIFDVRTLRRAP
jgi:DUF1680 family protein